MKSAQPVAELSAPSKADSNTTNLSRHASRRRIGDSLLKHGAATVREWANDALGNRHMCAKYTLQRAGVRHG